ncbi:MAPEG family protein [Synechococcus sp. A15-127]|uniref:MAPEG family protein n=1 Tax=Synechococcus sp. A15-127 TaxID=1050624 RepID=UPI001648F572|nr:MAPEG family protein [Synechococcus sp. A15-127]QNI94875.1 MAPEG family protein [Synechococcus sp. A15-127]
MTALSHSSIVSTTPYVWSLVLSLGTLLISIILIYIARFQAKLEIKDLAALRTMFDRYPAWGKRASWAQQNSFESFTIHAPAALLAVIASFNGQTLPAITVYAALAHPLFRVAYISAYVFNVPFARSVSWMLGLLCSGILYFAGFSALM